MTASLARLFHRSGLRRTSPPWRRPVKQSCRSDRSPFTTRRDIKDLPQFGLIAEEVAKVNPALVLPDKEGKPYTVRYDAGERDVAQRVPQRA